MDSGEGREMMACLHCGTSNPPRIDNHWLFYCPKCGRGELRPLPVELPLEKALLFPQKTVERKKEEPRLSQCPDCGVEFMTKSHYPTPRCPACRKERKRRQLRNRWLTKKKERLMQEVAGCAS